jgi:disulfide bond formation protein DsbB
MLPSWLSSRHVFLGLFLLCTGMMGFGYYLQYALGLEPCPLCMTQRVFIVAVGLTGLVAAVYGPRSAGGIRACTLTALLFCLLGSAFSARHVWLQSLPAEQVPACGPSIDYILDTFPPMEALEVLLRGNGSCATIDWSLLGLSIPAWTLVAFAGIAGVLLWTAVSPRLSVSK